jgi:predicted permease
MALGEYIKAGFGVTIGSIAALILFLLVAIGIFIGGWIIVHKELKKPKDKRSTSMLVIGFILMGLGMVVGLGFGAPMFFASLGEAM